MGKTVEQSPVEKKRILVVDAFPMLRHGLDSYLNARPDIVVCGEADSIPSALIKIAECKPHLLVIGLRLGAADCVEFVKALKVQTPGLLILVYSGFEESIFAMRALRAGASGYLMKRAPRDEMLAAISDILRGEIYVSRELAMHVFKEALATQPGFRLPGRAARIENLSDREMHVFHLLGSGLGPKKIAHALNLSVKRLRPTAKTSNTSSTWILARLWSSVLLDMWRTPLSPRQGNNRDSRQKNWCGPRQLLD